MSETSRVSAHLRVKKPTEIKAFRRWSMGWQNDLSNTLWIEILKLQKSARCRTNKVTPGAFSLLFFDFISHSKNGLDIGGMLGVWLQLVP